MSCLLITVITISLSVSSKCSVARVTCCRRKDNCTRVSESNLICSETEMIFEILDQCIDDGSINGVENLLEIYCACN
ncbi:unnamed protein product [Rotaria socialis]|uniref:Uncharacterized protein n=2 Tax=Rotaria TaxID=231623 RepID=A0A8S2NXG0_9BILA|nr:unnamed protein product [Rotaria socialis]CAF4016923.1 unnamed protein product [Rotaria magnacalcarata]CAF4017617.1 unnamed protein product [Rotaria magnacalcarata]CAF4129479.1 unnamed protein product [Rotaria magnacalcarata]CAF4489345.1 unnamed protein product [Rotaria socialis]